MPPRAKNSIRARTTPATTTPRRGAYRREWPTQKPVEIFARPIRWHTKPGDLCFEPFSGSGTQIVAAEQLGRRCYAMELEPRFVDVAVERWEKLTGKKAELAAQLQS